MSQRTIEELVDIVQSDITVFGLLPKNLPDQSIRQFVETRALPYFYRNYIYAVSKMYYMVHKDYFKTEEYTRFKYVELPCEIIAINWIYKVRGDQLLQLGINVPNLSVNLGVSNQPYLSSYVTTIGELGVYKTIIDSMADMLNQLNLYTVKFDFNDTSHRLNILTDLSHHLVLECSVAIPNEDLFCDHQFVKYVTAWAKMQQGNMLGRLDFTLPGGVKYNTADLVSQGKEEMKEVEDEIKAMSGSIFMFMIKR